MTRIIILKKKKRNYFWNYIQRNDVFLFCFINLCMYQREYSHSKICMANMTGAVYTKINA